MLKKSKDSKSIKRLIIAGSILASLLLFLMSYLVTLKVFERSITNSAHKNAVTLSQLTFDRMYEVMSKGWNRQQLQDFMADTQKTYQLSNITIDIYRSAAVAERYGELETNLDPQISSWVEESFYQEKSQTHFANNKITSLIPLKAEAKCLECHRNSKANDALGIMHITQDLSKEIQEVEKQFLLFFLLLLPLPIVIAFVIAHKLSGILNKSLHILRNQVTRINNMEDLKNIENLEVSKYSEFKKLGDEFQSLANRLRTIAVDREVLEFEIKLLDKFIITSDVIKDWKAYLLELLEEINQFIYMKVLYVSFVNPETQQISIEVFWSSSPSDKLKNDYSLRIERQITEGLKVNKEQLVFNHHLVDKESCELDNKELISLRHKVLNLEAQQVKGQVGVGVDPAILNDLTRSIVVESFLSTLLNVIGSIQAINNYTQQLEYFAMRDPLTNLFNQRIFNELLRYEIGRANRKDYSFTLMVIDFDNFKHINDLHGHAVGDLMLQSFANSVQQVLRTGDIFARYGGDEFTLILPDSGIQTSLEVANRILATVRGIEEVTDNGSKVQISCSIGLATYPDHAQDSKELFIVADNMMYRSKNIGKDQVSSPLDKKDINQLANTNAKAALLLEVLDNPDWIEPHFQPIATTSKTGEPAIHELLMRIRYKGEVLSAHQFIDIAENMGIVQKLDIILIEKAFKQVKEHNYQGLMFINLSPKALMSSCFTERITQLASKYKINPQKTVFELTERETVRNFEQLTEFINQLKLKGFSFAIDDFGSGFSSYHYLKLFPIDYLKIEGSFIANLLEDNTDLAFVKSAVILAQTLGIKTVAEFVETQDILDAVINLNIDYAQGYYLGKPQENFKEVAI